VSESPVAVVFNVDTEIDPPAPAGEAEVCTLVKLKTELDRSYSIECDHHINHNGTYYTISKRNDELFIFFKY